MKKALIIACIVIPIIILVYLSLPWTLLFVNSIVEGIKYDPSTEPQPAITYGEFPVELTYQIDGEIKTVSGILVCKYSHYDLEDRYWSSSLKETDETGFLIYEDKEVEIFCDVGCADYLMGEDVDPKYNEPTFFTKRNVWWNGGSASAIDEEELYLKYKIKVISWNVADPIVNSFQEFESIN